MARARTRLRRNFSTDRERRFIQRMQTKETIMKVLMVITSHDQLGNTGRKTGFWLEELAAPYYVFKDAGVDITLASPKGGRPPLDPKSNEPEIAHRAHAPVRKRRRGGSATRPDRSPRQRKAGRLRHGVLSGRSRPDVGSRRGQGLHQTDRVVPRRRQDNRRRVSFDRCAAPRQDRPTAGPWCKARK